MLRQREDRSSEGVRSGADSPPAASLLGADKKHKETAAHIHLVNIKRLPEELLHLLCSPAVG